MQKQELHPSHTSNSQFLWKTGNFKALQKQQQPEQCCQGSRTIHIHGFCWAGKEEQRCPLVFRGKLVINPWQFLAFLPNHGQRRIPSSERIHPSKPRCQEHKCLPQKREHLHNAHKGEPTLLLPKFPVYLKLGNSFGCIYPSNSSQNLDKSSCNSSLSAIPGQFRNPIFSRKTLSKRL